MPPSQEVSHPGAPERRSEHRAVSTATKRAKVCRSLCASPEPLPRTSRPPALVSRGQTREPRPGIPALPRPSTHDDLGGAVLSGLFAVSALPVGLAHEIQHAQALTKNGIGRSGGQLPVQCSATFVVGARLERELSDKAVRTWTHRHTFFRFSMYCLIAAGGPRPP